MTPAAEALKESYNESELKKAVEKTEHKMRCVSCNSNDWESVDQYRLKQVDAAKKPIGMAICKCCGMVSYPSKWKTEEEIKAHYRTDYRKPPSHHNLFTGQRKIYFHNAFLSDVFKDWANKKKKHPQVFEIGAAYGTALAWVKSSYPSCTVNGTELTTSFRLNAREEYGIELQEDFDTSRKYDLIMSYKVAEHQLDIDKELRKYAEHLTNDGLLYISVPIWFDEMTNFGMSGFDLEYYYDTNHINCWTRKIFENLLKKAGLEIVKEDHIMYDSTYLCKRNDELMNAPIEFEDPVKIKDTMDRMKRAYLAYTENKYDEAISIWPNYPTAHVSRMEMNRKQNFQKGWEWTKENVIEQAFRDCPNSGDVIIAATDMSMRFEKWEEAIKYAETCLRLKPENPVSLNHLISIMREMATRSPNDETRIHYFTEARNIARHLRNVSTQHFKEATDMIYLYNSQLS